MAKLSDQDVAACGHKNLLQELEGEDQSLAEVGGILGGDVIDLLLHASDIVHVGRHDGAVKTRVDILGLLGVLQSHR